MPDNKKTAAAPDAQDATGNKFTLHEVENIPPGISAAPSPNSEHHTESGDVATYLAEMIECLQKLAHQRGFKSLSYMLEVARIEAEHIHAIPAPAEYENSIGSD